MENLITRKTFTSKKQLPCVLIMTSNSSDALVTSAIIQRTDGSFAFHDNTHTNGKIGDFDERPFLEAYADFSQKKEEARLRKEQEAKEAEEKRKSELKERILKCQSVQELADEFNLSTIGNKAIALDSREDVEIIELAKELHPISVEWAGYEHNRTFGKGSFYWVYDLAHFQENIRSAYSNGNNYFYKSKETEAESYTGSVIPDILDDEDLSDEERLEAIKKAVEEWETIEPGYYDCNGSLIIEDKTLDDPDFTYCSEDSKSWQFCVRFESESFDEEEED